MFISRLIPTSIKKKFIRTIYTTEKEYVISVLSEPELKGKVAIVTGGSGVIGRAICIKLCSMGAKVYVAGRNEKKVAAVVNEAKKLGLLAEPLFFDLVDDISIENAFDKVRVNEDKLDILVNCAGGGARNNMKKLADQDIDIINQIIDSNLRGTILCTRKAAQFMMSQKNGKIIAISSTVGVQGKKNYSEYAASKSGLFGFVKSMALELGPYNVNINCIVPGYIQRENYSDDQIDSLKRTNAMHNIGTPEDIANAVAFFVSEDSKFITGQCLCVDGGRTLGLYGDTK